ncbi:MAG: hypothetical protein ABII06_11410 [Pseudomonadota bacterium]
MKKTCFGIIGLLICICIHFTVAGAQEKKGPRLVIKEKSFDAGEIDEGRNIEHVFNVSNEGDSVLEIEQVKPG